MLGKSILFTNMSLPARANGLIGKQVTKARAATLQLPHGPVQLPIFMPVATQGSLKGLTPKQVEETSCRLCLNNTYHLYDSLVARNDVSHTYS